MKYSRAAFVTLSILIIVKIIVSKGLDAAVIGSIVILAAGSMIWFSDVLVQYLNLGFWERFATDFKKAENSSAALVFLGWVVILIFGISVFFS